MTSQFSLFDFAPSVEGIDLAKVEASYSSDIIAMSGRVRKPVLHGGVLWVSTGGWSKGDKGEQHVYQLQPLKEFRGDPTTYYEKLSIWNDGDQYPGDYARNDPNGFYHGMTAKHGGEKYVLVGPEQQVGRLPFNRAVRIEDDAEEIVDELDGDDLEDSAPLCEYCDGEVNADGDCAAACDGWHEAAADYDGQPAHLPEPESIHPALF